MGNPILNDAAQNQWTNLIATGDGVPEKQRAPRLIDNLDLLTVEQLAEMLGKRPQTIRNWVARRLIPFTRGRPVMFLRPSIMAWLKSREVQPWQ